MCPSPVESNLVDTFKEATIKMVRDDYLMTSWIDQAIFHNEVLHHEFYACRASVASTCRRSAQPSSQSRLCISTSREAVRSNSKTSVPRLAV